MYQFNKLSVNLKHLKQKHILYITKHYVGRQNKFIPNSSHKSSCQYVCHLFQMFPLTLFGSYYSSVLFTVNVDTSMYATSVLLYCFMTSSFYGLLYSVARFRSHVSNAVNSMLYVKFVKPELVFWQINNESVCTTLKIDLPSYINFSVFCLRYFDLENSHLS